MNNPILAIDDDINFLNSLKKNLENIHHDVTIISNSSKALNEIINPNYSCILLDVKMPGIDGVELLQKSISENPLTPVIMVSGQSDIKIAVESIKLGAFDFLEKPVDIKKLHLAIKNAISKYSLSVENQQLLNELKEEFKFIGASKATLRIIDRIRSVAETNAKVLIQGETGTGKELIAWAIHHNSNRRAKPYIKINCAAIPSALLESELFGHSKGAFTGAIDSKDGKFVAADGGTLFLDEIGDMSLDLQAKILRVIEYNEVNKIGNNEPIKVDVRIIAATNKDLAKEIELGNFRSDLYYRLNVVNINIDPLRERKDDIIPLSKYFLSKFNTVYNKQIRYIDDSAENELLNYDWKGNVRELKNIIEKAVIFSTNDVLNLSDIKKAMGYLDYLPQDDVEKAKSLKEAKLEFERKYITDILKKNDWRIIQTAQELGIDRTNLFKKMQSLGIEKDK